jgi:nucleoid-associated protein YgaU
MVPSSGAAFVAGGIVAVLACGSVTAAHIANSSDSTAPVAAAAGPVPTVATPAVPTPAVPTPAVPTRMPAAPTPPAPATAPPSLAVSPPTPSLLAPTAAPSPSPTVTVTSGPATITVSPSASPAYPSTLTIVYTVRRGDNLSVIAAWFHTHGYGAIYAANKAVIGRNPALIHPGQKLKIVGGTPTTTP